MWYLIFILTFSDGETMRVQSPAGETEQECLAMGHEVVAAPDLAREITKQGAEVKVECEYRE